MLGQAENNGVVKQEIDTKDDQLQSKGETRATYDVQNNSVQVHPEIGVMDGVEHMPTERTWQDMWPKNDKEKRDDDETAYVAVCKADMHQKSLEEMKDIDEAERTWNDMWP